MVAGDSFTRDAHSNQGGPAFLNDMDHSIIGLVNVKTLLRNHQVRHTFFWRPPVYIDNLYLLLGQTFGKAGQTYIDYRQRLIKQGLDVVSHGLSSSGH
jgi:hypothetical protein